jgi:hypothetical protein
MGTLFRVPCNELINDMSDVDFFIFFNMTQGPYFFKRSTKPPTFQILNSIYNQVKSEFSQIYLYREATQTLKTNGRLDISKANCASKKNTVPAAFFVFRFKKWKGLIFNPFRVDLLCWVSLFPPVSPVVTFVQPLRGWFRWISYLLPDFIGGY